MLKIYLRSGVLKIPCRSIHMAYTYYKTVPDRLPPVIIMHGLLGSKRNWNQMGLLIHKNTNPARGVYLVDARNHGESPHLKTHSYPHMAEDIKTFLVRHKIKKAALLGHSMGGRAMMYFTLTYVKTNPRNSYYQNKTLFQPDLVEKLIVGDVSPGSSGSSADLTEAIIETLTKVKMPKNVPSSQAKALVDMQLSKRIPDLVYRKFLLNNLKSDEIGRYIILTISNPQLA